MATPRPESLTTARMRFHPFFDDDCRTVYCNLGDAQRMHIDQPCLLMGGNDNIFHFLLDILAKHVSFQEFPELAELKLVFFNLLNWQRDVLQLFDLTEDRVIDIQTELDEPYLFEFDRMFTTIPPPTPVSYDYFSQHLDQTVCAEPDSRYRRIYLSRSELPPLNRVANEEEVRGTLGAMGFEVVFPDQHSLPIRLTPMTATCRVPPLSRVKLGIGWSRGVARDAEQ